MKSWPINPGWVANHSLSSLSFLVPLSLTLSLSHLLFFPLDMSSTRSSHPSGSQSVENVELELPEGVVDEAMEEESAREAFDAETEAYALTANEFAEMAAEEEVHCRARATRQQYESRWRNFVRWLFEVDAITEEGEALHRTAQTPSHICGYLFMMCEPKSTVRNGRKAGCKGYSVSKLWVLIQ